MSDIAYDGSVVEGQYSDYVGAIYTFFGPLAGEYSASEADSKWVGEVTSGQAGKSCAGAGDVNGDGYDDILVGAPENSGEEVAYLLYGPVSGEHSLSDADARFTHGGDYAMIGYSVTPAGDANDDGFDDFWVSIPGFVADDGMIALVALVHGPVYGEINVHEITAGIRGATAAEGGAGGLGLSVVGNFDLNGDGIDDIGIGAPYYDGSTGYVFLIYGGLGW